MNQQKLVRIHNGSWIIYIITMIFFIAFILASCGESVSERSANEARDYGVDKHEHRLRSLEERVTALENGK